MTTGLQTLVCPEEGKGGGAGACRVPLDLGAYGALRGESP